MHITHQFSGIKKTKMKKLRGNNMEMNICRYNTQKKKKAKFREDSKEDR